MQRRLGRECLYVREGSWRKGVIDEDVAERYVAGRHLPAREQSNAIIILLVTIVFTGI